MGDAEKLLGTGKSNKNLFLIGIYFSIEMGIWKYCIINKIVSLPLIWILTY